MLIRDIRKKTGMTQEQFATRFGIALPTLRRWEQLVSEPPAYLIPLLQQVLEINESTPIEGKHGEKYFYNNETCMLSDSYGNTVMVKINMNSIKKENLKLYVTDLFSEINSLRDYFEKECNIDKRSDIVWIER